MFYWPTESRIKAVVLPTCCPFSSVSFAVRGLKIWNVGYDTSTVPLDWTTVTEIIFSASYNQIALSMPPVKSKVNYHASWLIA